jgi:DNA primase
MNPTVQKIKERLSIVDVVSSYLTVEKAGKNFKAKCPFHNEKTPSFSISPDKGIYYCFGCGAKGDIFSFVEHFEGINFLGALKILAERAGVEISSYSHSQKDKNDVYYDIMEEATSFFEKNFTKNDIAKDYLVKRGLNEKSLTTFRIGYAPDSWSLLLEHLVNKNYRKEDIEKVGLIKKNDNRYYDRFRSRIMFPINDSSGRVIAFSGRIFSVKEGNTSIGKESDFEQAKYINSPETPLFNKSNILFGIDKAKNSIRSCDYSIIVEGQMDLILSHQAGFTNTVAVSGTAFTDSINDNQFHQEKNETGEVKINNLGLIKRLSSNIIFAYDGDDAGIRAVGRSAMIALSLGMHVKVVVFPKGKDPADIIQEDYKKWEKIIKNKVDIISFNLDKIIENNENREYRRKAIVEKIFPFLIILDSSIKKSNYIKEIYEKTGISENAIMEDYKNFEKKNNTDNVTIKLSSNDIVKINSRRKNLEKKMFGIIFWKGVDESQISQIELLRASFEKEIGSDLYQKMLEIYTPNSENLSFETEMWYGDKINTLIIDLKEIILNLEEEIFNEQIYSLGIKIKEKERDKININQELSTYQKLVEKIEDIKKSRSK